MTEQTAFILFFIPVFIALALMRLSGNPRYLLPAACLFALSGILVLLFSHQYKYLCFGFFGVALFVLFVAWYRKWWEQKKRH